VLVIETVGAWAGSWALSNPSDAVDLATACGMRRLCVIVNDHSKWRTPHDFTIRNPSKIERLAARCAGADIEVVLMSWCCPDKGYLDGARHDLGRLAENTGAAAVEFDAEEPWTLFKAPWGYTGDDNEGIAEAYQEAAAYLDHIFNDVDCDIGVNAIGFTPHRALAPLIEVADYAVPQMYITSTSGLKPGGSLGRIRNRWVDMFEWEPEVVGLAAYRQKLDGYTTAGLMRAAFEDAEVLGAHTAIYWQLKSFKSKTKRKAIRSLVDERRGAGLAA